MRGLVAAVVLLATAAGQDEILQARKLSADGKQGLALALYESVLEKTPDSYDANFGAGMVLDLEGQYAKARKYLRKALAVAPAQSKAQALTAMAVSYAFTRDCKDSSRYEKEVYDLRLSAQDWIGAAETADEAGRICLESASLDEAEKWYSTGRETALKKPDLPSAETDLWALRWEHAQARIASRRGKPAEAGQHAAAVKVIVDKGSNPAQAVFYLYLTGYLAFYHGDYKTASAELEKADQRDPFVMSLLAQALEKSGKKDKAVELYRKIMTINAHSPANAFARPVARKKLEKVV